jgi:protein-glutamine gamma-glutamyltransferase
VSNALRRLPTVIMLAAFASGVLLHVDRAPLWCLGVAVAAMLWHWLHHWRRVPLPGSILRLLLTLALLGAVATSFGSVTGLAAGSSLLVTMGAAKLLETRTSRDATVMAIVALLLMLAASLDRQALLRMPLYLLTGWIALATLAALSGTHAASSAWRAFSTPGRALLVALPLAALCFVLVPRLPGALWSMPTNEQAQTGLSDEMSPGSISELSISDDIAFRVRFEGPAPPMGQRYWRGPVLHDFDGYTWRRQPGQGAVVQRPAPLSPPVRYRVLLEPHGRNYLFGLDTIAALEGRRNIQSFDGQVQAFRPITSAITYDGVSHVQTRYSGPLSLTGRKLDSRLPAGRNPRSIALARELRATADSDLHYTRLVLDYFRTKGFEYTLTPPLLDRSSVDDLIFNTRRGFCGHFASAYVTLMRAAGIPARVVTGYMGGTWNSVGGYYAVRQSQAHAWAEVWIDGDGWVRIDPTAVVAPERVRRGTSELLGQNDAALNGILGDAAWLRDLRDSWDAASNWWQERIVNFNRSAQLNLLRYFGLDRIDYRGMTLLLIAAGAVWALLLWLLLVRRSHTTQSDALGRVWNRFIKVLGSRGLTIAAHEGPQTIAMRAAARLPAVAAELQKFTNHYSQLRFGKANCDSAQIKSLRRRLRQLEHATATHRRSRTTAAAPR